MLLNMRDTVLRSINPLRPLSWFWKRREFVFPGTTITAGRLFDAAWYIQTNNLAPDQESAWEHFTTVGWKTGAQPCQIFDTIWYLEQYKDVRDSGVNPLYHFIEHGLTELRQPHPLFDTAWYVEQNKDVFDNGVNPILHYLENGIREGRNPIKFFDDFWYLSQYGDVARSRILPIYHYHKFGIAEGRNPSESFDTKYYLQQNPDINCQITDPLFHFVTFGQFEMRRHKSPGISIYDEWIRDNEANGPSHNGSLRATIALFTYLPTFSIVVPVYDTPLVYLEAFIDSVRNQIYPFWELCICDDASQNPKVRDELTRYSKMDSRIKITFGKTNLHIAGATNIAMAMATGDFICLMDHDDEITVNALYEFALRLNIDRDLDMIYSDEDKKNLANQRYDPFFKPDWSPEYLESCMYTAHFACYRKTVVDKVGGFREECNGAQDYDFVLRFTQQTSKIAHVNKILYHWRAIPGSTAASMDNKDYVIGAAVRALEDYLRREGSEGVVNPGAYNGCFDVCRAVKGNPKVSVIIPTAGRESEVRGERLDLLSNCVKSVLLRSTYKNIEVVVVHNGDLNQQTLTRLSSFPVKYVKFEGEFNIARKVNLGVASASGDFVIIFNDDIEVIEPAWVEAMLTLAQKPGVGVVGARLLFENGQIQHAGVSFFKSLPDHVLRGSPGDDPGYFFSTIATRNYSAVTGACMLCSTELFNKVGGLTESFVVNYNDVDFCLKVRQLSLRIVYAARAKLFHFESQNRSRSVESREIDLFLEKWKEVMRTDHFYSDNLDSHPPDFKIKVFPKPFGGLDMPRFERANDLATSSLHGPIDRDFASPNLGRHGTVNLASAD